MTNVTPRHYPALLAEGERIGFTMGSDTGIGALLRVLIASKPGGNFLELGTGISLTLAYMTEAMDRGSTVLSVDNDPALIQIAERYFGGDERVRLVCADGAAVIGEQSPESYDLIFADTWAGKYNHLGEAIHLLKLGGFYVIDDMDEQPNWPPGHADKAAALRRTLRERGDLALVELGWSTGIILGVRVSK